MRSSSSNMRSGHLLCLLLSLFGDVSSAAGQGNVLENIVRGRTPLPLSLRSSLPGMPLASRADAPPEGKAGVWQDREMSWETSFEAEHLFRHRCARHSRGCHWHPALTRPLRGRQGCGRTGK